MVWKKEYVRTTRFLSSHPLIFLPGASQCENIVYMTRNLTIWRSHIKYNTEGGVVSHHRDPDQ